MTKIEDLMQQELPNLVDERRFRRREPDQVERDEFGRVKAAITLISDLVCSRNSRKNGPRSAFPSIWSLYRASTYGHKLLVMVVLT